MPRHLTWPSRLSPIVLLAVILLLTSLTPAPASDGRTLAKYNTDLDAKLMAEAQPWDKPLMPAFIAASREYRVPLPLLLTLAHLGSSFENRGGAPTIEGGYGVMALRDNILGGESLALGSSLTGAGMDVLRFDPEANIRAAAAVIANYGGSLRQRGSQGLDGWLNAVIKYAALDPESSRFFAHEVFSKLQDGLSAKNRAGEEFSFASQSIGKVDLNSLKPKSMQQISIQSVDYGPAIWDPAASCNYTATVSAKDTIAIHTIEGTAAGAVSYFKNCNADVSAHYVIAENGTIWQCVDERYKAWHCGCYNSRAIGFEHEGYAGSSSHPTTLYNASAALAQEICNERGIPKNHTSAAPGIMGHNDINVICGGTHWDPGPGWDWGYYINRVQGVQPSVPPLPATQAPVDIFNKFELFGRAGDGALHWKMQNAPGAWTDANWMWQGGAFTSIPKAIMNSAWRFQIFVRTSDGSVSTVQQNAAGAWQFGSWVWLGDYDFVGDVAAVLNTANKIELFARTSGGALMWKMEDAPNGGWSNATWLWEGNGITSDPAVARDSSGKMNVFARDANGALVWKIQSAPGSYQFSDWMWLGGNFVGKPTVVLNQAGRFEVFVRQADGSIATTIQAAPGDWHWSSWIWLGSTFSGPPAAVLANTGKIELLARSTTGSVMWKPQDNPNGGWNNATWSWIMNGAAADPVASKDFGGKINVFARQADGTVVTTIQNAPGDWRWSSAIWLGGGLAGF